MNNATVYGPPSTKKYFDTYPELAKEQEFKDLDDKELKFAWYFGNETSPYNRANVPDTDRISKSYDIAFGKDVKAEKKLKFIKEIPEKIKLAITRMAMYDVDIRLRARFIVEEGFANIESAIVIDSEALREMEIDDRKRYVEMSTKALKELPDLVDTLERGFGVKERKKSASTAQSKKAGDERSLADRVLET